MKILKYLLYFIVGLIILFLGFGLIHSHIHYGHEITVNKPITEAWDVSQDTNKYAQWLEGFQSMELIEGEAQKIGSKYKVIVDPGEGQPLFEMIETLVDYNPPNYATLHFDSDMMDFDQTISFKEANGQTTVKTDSKVTGKNIMLRSMFAIMEIFGGSFTAQETKNIEALKKLIEENTTNYSPVMDISTDSLSVE